MAQPRPSVVIPNYNYGRFIARAIESALVQRPRPEVVVVDDGSTDDSHQILARYRGDVVLIEKANEGQLTALNVGVEASSGDVVHILDADDMLLDGAVSSFLKPFVKDSTIAKVHWPMPIVDAQGRRTGRRVPDSPLPSGDLLHYTLDRGPDGYATPPTSGNAWSRSFLESALPFPKRSGRATPDGYLSMLAPFHGDIVALPQSLSVYRLHGANVRTSMPFDTLLDRNIRLWEWRAGCVAEWCRERGFPSNLPHWRAKAWVHLLDASRRDLLANLPPDEAFVLIDDSQWGMTEASGWKAIPYVERAGEYWGPPSDDEEAITELLRQQRSGVSWVVLAWPAFWYLEQYPGLAEAFERMTPVVLNDRIRVYRMAAR